MNGMHDDMKLYNEAIELLRQAAQVALDAGREVDRLQGMIDRAHARMLMSGEVTGKNQAEREAQLLLATLELDEQLEDARNVLRQAQVERDYRQNLLGLSKEAVKRQTALLYPQAEGG